MTVTIRKSSDAEVPRNVVNRAARGDNRPRLTAEGLRAYDEMSMDELREKSNEQMRQGNWDERADTDYLPMYAAFAKRHPELRKYNDHNSTAIIKELETAEGLGPMNRAGRPEPNMWDLEMATTRAMAKSALKLDEAVVREQRIAAIEEEAARQDRLDPETMPMHQLRALANGVYDPLGPK